MGEQRSGMRMNNGIVDMGWLQVRARDEGRPPE